MQARRPNADFLPDSVQANLKVFEQQEEQRCSSDASLLRLAGSVPQGPRALGVPFLPLQRAAFFQATSPGCPAGDTKVRMA